MCASRDETTGDFLKAMSAGTLGKMFKAIKVERAEITIERAGKGWGEDDPTEDMYLELIDCSLAELETDVGMEQIDRMMK